MKKLHILFQQFKEVGNYNFILYDHLMNFVASTGDDSKNYDKMCRHLIIVDDEEKPYVLYSKEPLQEEVLKLIQFIIKGYFLDLKSYNKEDVLKLLLQEKGNTPLYNRGQRILLKNATLYRLIMIKVSDSEGQEEVFKIVKESLKGYKTFTPIKLFSDIVVFADGEEYTSQKLTEIFSEIRSTINAELLLDPYIAISKKYNKMEDILMVLQEVMETINIGKLFYPVNHVYQAGDLKLEGIIYSIPPTERTKIYIELFQKDIYDKINEEMYHTIKVFLDCNLNLGEAAGKLYIHRNTLTYRLDKLCRETGLDIRRFNDAVIMKISMLLKKSI